MSFRNNGMDYKIWNITKILENSNKEPLLTFINVNYDLNNEDLLQVRKKTINKIM